MLHRPIVEHESATAARQQAGLLAKLALVYEVIVKRGVKFRPFRTAERFSDVDTRDRDAVCEKPLKHPDLGLSREPAQSRRIPDPRYIGLRIRRQDDESVVTIELKGLAWHRQALGTGGDNRLRGSRCATKEQEYEKRANDHNNSALWLGAVYVPS